MPNAFAYLIFFSWPLVVYFILRRQPLVPALVWSIILGLLLLPSHVGFDIPAFPTIGKHEITAISAAVICFIKSRNSRNLKRRTVATGSAPPPRSRSSRIAWILLILVFTTPVFTILSNSDPIIAGPRFIPGLRLYDAFSVSGAIIFTMLPFVLGMRFLDAPESHATILKILCYAMLAYSLFALWEVRMSPQLNRQIYGFVSSSFAQHVRAGGFRPLVFFEHGLALGIFLSMSVLSALAVWRHTRADLPGVSRPGIWFFFAGWLFFTLILAKTIGPLMITLALMPIIILTKPRIQLLTAAILSAIVLFYPILRGAGYIPTEAIHEFVLERDAKRAQSFKFRLDNEDALLAKANQRPALGWGTWGRNHIFDENTGARLSITDGAWIIIIGSFGWLGYITRFGLLTIPLILLAMKRRSFGIDAATSGLALVLSANLIDLLPNAALTPFTWLLAGALAGRLVHVSKTAFQPQAQQTNEARTDPISIIANNRAKIKRARRISTVDPNTLEISKAEQTDSPKSKGTVQREKRST